MLLGQNLLELLEGRGLLGLLVGSAQMQLIGRGLLELLIE